MLNHALRLVALAGLAFGAATTFGQPASQPKPADTTKPAEPKPAETKPAPAKPADVKPGDAKAADPYVLGFKMKDIDGKVQDLAQYKGKVIMIVNVASQCGNTPQYAGLQKLFDEKKDKGFVILAFPANNFGEQEPGSDSEIKQFCTSKYSVTFPVFSKISVKDKNNDQCELYKKIVAQPKPIGGDIEWNFQKFIVDRNGNVVARFSPKTDPQAAALTRKIDELLAEKPAAEKPSTTAPTAKPSAEKPATPAEKK